MAETVALIDYGAGNLHSVHNALKAAGAQRIAVTSDPYSVAEADRIVLPGVGAFAACMEGLAAIPGMIDALDMTVIEKARPFLGICVGMQMMAERGEEHGSTAGLGWIPGSVRALEPSATVKIPHMGWNDVRPTAPHTLIEPGEAYYLHGFAFAGEHVLATTDHGGTLVAAIGRDNLIGVQFHPEKSQRYGLDFLASFLGWRP